MNTRPPEFGVPALARTLSWLRFCAVVGQSAAVLFVAQVLQLPLDQSRLFAGIGVLAVFALAVRWRLQRAAPVGSLELMLHVALDTAVLGWLLYQTGGAGNPFVGLLLMPVTLAAMTLRPRHVIAVATITTGTYLVLMRWHQPLPGMHGHPDSGFDLHVLGMAASYAISAVLLGWFISRLALALRNHQAQAQRIRERALRDEGILAIATQAAGAAHELNTPLSTMRILLTELQREHVDGELAQDLALLAGQVERCRDSLRELVAVGKAQLDQSSEQCSLGDFIADCRDRFMLLRPEITLAVDLTPQAAELRLALPPGLRHALLSLLNNAAEASLANAVDRIELRVAQAGDGIEFRVRDYGSGIHPDSTNSLGTLFQTSKSTGLGIGLALATATAERLGGTLRIQPAQGTGVETCLSLSTRNLLPATATMPDLMAVQH